MTLSLEWIDEREGGGGALEERWMDMLEQLLHIAAHKEDISSGIVTLTLTNDAGIQALNREYRGLDKPTDVLSFSLVEGEDPNIRYEDEYESQDGDSDDDSWTDDEEPYNPFTDMLGDIVISVPRAEAQAADYGHSFERELGFLFVHGFLHLIGYDHENEEAEREMFAIQEAVLEEAGLTR